MGLTFADIRVEHPLTHRQLELRALVDSGSVFLTLPEHVALQLGFELSRSPQREVMLGDGSRQTVPMVGPVRVWFQDRYCDLSALVIGNEALFGAVPMEMMDLVLNPAAQKLTVNPDSPYIPSAVLKAVSPTST
jgi:clan AA aspartic protease